MDVTRFVPTALRVKRTDDLKNRSQSIAAEHTKLEPKLAAVSKDDAYLQFMREMEGLL